MPVASGFRLAVAGDRIRRAGGGAVGVGELAARERAEGGGAFGCGEARFGGLRRVESEGARRGGGSGGGVLRRQRRAGGDGRGVSQSVVEDGRRFGDLPYDARREAQPRRLAVFGAVGQQRQGEAGGGGLAAARETQHQRLVPSAVRLRRHGGVGESAGALVLAAPEARFGARPRRRGVAGRIGDARRLVERAEARQQGDAGADERAFRQCAGRRRAGGCEKAPHEAAHGPGSGVGRQALEQTDEAASVAAPQVAAERLGLGREPPGGVAAERAQRYPVLARLRRRRRLRRQAQRRPGLRVRDGGERRNRRRLLRRRGRERGEPQRGGERGPARRRFSAERGHPGAAFR